MKRLEEERSFAFHEKTDMKKTVHDRHKVSRVLSFFSRRRSWDSPTHSPAGECAPPPFGLGGGTVAHSLKKGQCHEIFDFCVFSRISFPQAPEYTIRVVLNFFENPRRYSQLKVCHRCQRHRWQMQKIFNHKSFNYLV
jgi:hypothetical protein